MKKRPATSADVVEYIQQRQASAKDRPSRQVADRSRNAWWAK